ncbi:hypothetical protein L484_012435 [Morus notabilis]|uniref:Uncharacterized protein n=1 Tax=Morus notabilis TaxID=981085 RepID=W9S138_9ROSA|nr:hypothetical protein L484_012435 [Morus notabilis]
MSNMLRKKHEEMETAYEIMESLEAMSHLDVVRTFMNDKMKSGTSVKAHVLNMIEHFYEAEVNGARIDEATKEVEIVSEKNEEKAPEVHEDAPKDQNTSSMKKEASGSLRVVGSSFGGDLEHEEDTSPSLEIHFGVSVEQVDELAAFLSSLDFGESAAQSIEDIIQEGGERKNIYEMSVPRDNAFINFFPLSSPRCSVVESICFFKVDLCLAPWPGFIGFGANSISFNNRGDDQSLEGDLRGLVHHRLQNGYLAAI